MWAGGERRLLAGWGRTRSVVGCRTLDVVGCMELSPHRGHFTLYLVAWGCACVFLGPALPSPAHARNTYRVRTPAQLRRSLYLASLLQLCVLAAVGPCPGDIAAVTVAVAVLGIAPGCANLLLQLPHRSGRELLRCPARLLLALPLPLLLQLPGSRLFPLLLLPLL